MTTVNTVEAPDPAEQPRPQSWGDIAVHFAHRIARDNFPRGDRAELRRMDSDKPDPAVFWRLLAKEGLAVNGRRNGGEGVGAHSPRHRPHDADQRRRRSPPALPTDRYTPVGRALFLGGESQRTEGFYSETRLNRLLTSREAMLRTLLARMFRTLASAGASFNWREMSQFILSDGHDEEEAERARRRIARAYYQAERRNAQGSADDSN